MFVAKTDILKHVVTDSYFVSVEYGHFSIFFSRTQQAVSLSLEEILQVF